jgi:alpha-galactosidase
VNGWQCWSPSGTLESRRPGDFLFPLFMPRFLKPMLANTATPVSSEKGRFESEWFAALGDLDAGDSVIIGFTGLSRALSQVSVRLGRTTEQSALEATARFEGKRPERGREFWGEPLAIIGGDLSGANLERYADLAAADQWVRETRHPAAGWSSWYQYSRQVTREDVRSNLDLAADRYAALGLELVQVDDGYQAAVGDWLEAGDGFAGGMKEVAEEIEARGKVPGIWVAPFTATRRSRLFAEHRDWFIRVRRKRAALAGISPDWKGRYYGLDLTNPEVLEHLRDVFGTLAGFGYRFFKLDFLATGLLEGRRHDPSLTRAEAARRALTTIREAVGEESVLMAAGGPVMLGAGILDVQRVGPDVAPAWRPRYQRWIRDRATPGARNCLINALTRSFMNGRLFEADPDCLMLRATDTRLNAGEIRTLASGIAVFGGAMLVSDDLALWGPEQEAMAARLLPHRRARARCPDLWHREVPRYLLSTLADPRGEYHLLWVVNWGASELEAEVGLDELGLEPGRYHACEFWTSSYLGETAGSFTLPALPPHASAVVRITGASDRPALVGSNIHVTQGAAEVARFEPRAGGLGIAFRSLVKIDAVAFLSMPGAAELRVSERDGPGGRVSIERLTTTVYRLEFELDREREIDLEWSEQDAGQSG